MLNLAVARILLRYLAMFMVTYGWLGPDAGREFMTDPDLVMVLGAGIGLLTEAWYALAKRLGQST